MKDIFLSKKGIQQILDDISEVAQYLWERGWAERNAGNISVNVTSFFEKSEREEFTSHPAIPLKKKYPDLLNQVFLVTGTGTRMRDMAKDPISNICLVYIGENSSACHIVCNCKTTGSIQPTSELPTHLSIQQLLLQKQAPETVVLHTHVLELIALTQIPTLKSEEALNRLLWGMHPETLIFVPDGIGFVPYSLPGTEKIAEATLKELEKHHVIVWEKHGCMAIGKNLLEAFDTIDILAKSAKIYFLCRMAGSKPEGLNTAQLSEIRSTYLH